MWMVFVCAVSLHFPLLLSLLFLFVFTSFPLLDSSSSSSSSAAWISKAYAAAVPEGTEIEPMEGTEPHVYFRAERTLISATGLANQCKNGKCDSSSSSGETVASQDDQGDDQGDNKKKSSSSSTGGAHSSSSSGVRSSSTGASVVVSSTGGGSTSRPSSSSSSSTQAATSSSGTARSSSSSTGSHTESSSASSTASSSSTASVEQSSTGVDQPSTGSPAPSSSGSDQTPEETGPTSAKSWDSSTAGADASTSGITDYSSTAGGDSLTSVGTASTSDSITSDSTTASDQQTSDQLRSTATEASTAASATTASSASSTSTRAGDTALSTSIPASTLSSSGVSSSFSTREQPTNPNWSSSSTGVSYTFCSGDWCLHGSGNEHNEDGTYTDPIVYGISMKLQLQLSVDEWNANKSSNVDRFKKDIAETIEPPIAPSRIKVDKVEAGSVIVDFVVLPGAGIEPIGVAIQLINAVNNTNSALYRNSSITSTVVARQAVTFSAIATARCSDGRYDTTCAAPTNPVGGSTSERFFGLTRDMFIISVVSIGALACFLIGALFFLLKRQRRKVEPNLVVVRVRRVPVKKAAPVETSVVEDNEDFDSRWGVNSQHDWVPHTPPLNPHNQSSPDIPALNFQSLDVRMSTPSATPREKEIIKANTIAVPPNSARGIRTAATPIVDSSARPATAEVKGRSPADRLAPPPLHSRDPSLSTDPVTQQLAQAIAQHHQELYAAHCRHIEQLVSSSKLLPAANFLNAEEAVETRGIESIHLPGRFSSTSDGRSSSASDSSSNEGRAAETNMLNSPHKPRTEQRKKKKKMNLAGNVTANFVSIPALIIPSPLSPSSPFSAYSDRKSPPRSLPPLAAKNGLSVAVGNELTTDCPPLSDACKRTSALGLQSPVRQGFALPPLPACVPFSPRMNQQPTPLSGSYLENVQTTNNFFTDSTHALSTYSSCEALSVSQGYPPALDLNAAPTETEGRKQPPKKRGMPKKRFPQAPLHLAAPSALNCTPSFPSSAAASSFSTPVPTLNAPLPPPMNAPTLNPQFVPSPLSSLDLRTLKTRAPAADHLVFNGMSLSGNNPLRESPGSMSSSLVSRSNSNQNSTVKALLPQLSQLLGFSELSPPAAVSAPVAPQLPAEIRAGVVVPNKNGLHFHFSRSLSNSPRRSVDHSRVPSRFESHTITEGDIQHDESMNYDDSRKSASVSPVHSEYVASRSSHHGKHRRTMSDSPSFIEALRKSTDAGRAASVSARDDLSIAGGALPALPALHRSRSFGAESVSSINANISPRLLVRSKQFAPED